MLIVSLSDRTIRVYDDTVAVRMRDNGPLCVYDCHGNLLAAYAPGRWRTCEHRTVAPDDFHAQQAVENSRPIGGAYG